MPRKRPLVTRARSDRRSTIRLALGLAAGTLAASAAVMPAGAQASGAYPGETLTLAQSSPAGLGAVTEFQASGQQTDVENEPGGFDLQVFFKPTSVDPSCGASYEQENNTWMADLANEFHPVVGDWQGSATTFQVPFKINFEKAGQFILCAYSTWVFDTAAAAQLTVSVAGGSSPAPSSTVTPSPSPSTTPAGSAVKPADTVRPKVTRSGGKLICNPGGWSGDPTSYAYGWLSNGHSLPADHARTLRITGRLHGKRIQCAVTASNASGRGSATSATYHLH